MGKQKIRIGGASAFWGDSATAPKQLIDHGEIDYLVFDYLSEVTMALLARQKMKDSNLGYIAEFTETIEPLLEHCQNKKIKLISNAGALNPKFLSESLKKIIKSKNLSLKVAFVEGDDVLGKNNSTKNLLTANAYLGAGPIINALENDADIVITGRHVDSAGVIAAMMYEFSWSNNNWDLLAAAGLAGHLIECGTQICGGNFTDWKDVPRPENIGFPIVECKASGDFFVTKPDSTGGMVSVGTVAEQLVYEIGDPENYILPDVICDFSNVKLEQRENNKVGVTGAKGKPAPNEYKISSTYLEDYRCSATFFVDGINAAEKAKSISQNILKKTERVFLEKSYPPFKKTLIEILGSGERYLTAVKENNEIVGRLSVVHESKEALDIFSSEIAPSSTALAPGLTSLFGGRPRVQPVVKLHSFFINKKEITAKININEKKIEYKDEVGVELVITEKASHFSGDNKMNEELVEEVLLEKLAWARSGDKGPHSNIGVIARKPEYLKYIKNSLSHVVVTNLFKNFLDENKEIKSFDLPGIDAINFLLCNSLDGGGLESLRVDPQGKAYAQRLLSLPIKVPKGLL